MEQIKVAFKKMGQAVEKAYDAICWRVYELQNIRVVFYIIGVVVCLSLLFVR